MTKFLLFIIILNFVVVGYNFYMWFTVQNENRELKKENNELKYLLNKVYGRNATEDNKNEIFFKNKE